MCTDIILAFVVALLFNMFGQISKIFKKLLIFVACVTLAAAYFIEGSLSFIGSMDLSIYIMFVIIFDYLVQGFEYWLCKKIKEF